MEELHPSSQRGGAANRAPMSLVELQKFLVDELATSDAADDFSRAFTPLTDGLGLDSPVKKEGAAPATPAKKAATVATRPAPPPTRSRVDEVFFSDTPEASALHDYDDEPTLPREDSREMRYVPQPERSQMPPPTLRDAEDFPGIELEAPKTMRQAARAAMLDDVPAPTPVPAPPQLPRVGFFRRFFAGAMDEAFVLTLCAGAFVITSRILAKSATPIPVQLLADFSTPLFQRFAALEFATLWLSYYAIGIGVLDMTFGMWVWGMRISYGKTTADTSFLRKLLRVVFSFFFFAPILPTLLLLVRIKGRNLLDFLSGTSVYRSNVG